MKSLKLVLALNLILSLAVLNESYVRVHNLTCAYNKSICSASHCSITNARGKNSYVNAACLLSKPVPSMWLHLRLLRQVRNTFEPFLFDFKQDVCNLKDIATDNYLFKRVVTMAVKNFKNLKCPLEGNVTVTRLPCMLFIFQGVVPPANYIVSGRIFNDDAELVTANLSFVVT